jgi:hypothetical protein
MNYTWNAIGAKKYIYHSKTRLVFSLIKTPPPSTRELGLLQKMAESSAYRKPYLNCIIEAQIDFSFRKLDYSF